ncbi:uncharacterized protein BDR25DRAFT_360342 [Lindgomyces ingoldianus]|uniref:Uncharacterized protein n=1 Tax=Lindgomyces ingoldianus TaxID=673940 RepID=A0ACB6QI46_9PLEO|nr:uncharacterized protein BDR25DRAFT_360342 [Lindgomyces ingoldianus]KAF2465816.1 hypothetical protein BDR25DRAFT_360342 [Lindgomyces ingoldianus]
MSAKKCSRIDLKVSSLQIQTRKCLPSADEFNNQLMYPWSVSRSLHQRQPFAGVVRNMIGEYAHENAQLLNVRIFQTLHGKTKYVLVPRIYYRKYSKQERMVSTRSGMDHVITPHDAYAPRAPPEISLANLLPALPTPYAVHTLKEPIQYIECFSIEYISVKTKPLLKHMYKWVNNHYAALKSAKGPTDFTTAQQPPINIDKLRLFPNRTLNS